MDITYAGVKLSDMFKVTDVRRGGILPSRTNYTLDVPSRHGQYYAGYKYNPREIEIDFIITNGQVNTTVRGLAWMLDLEEPSELIFSDEPTKLYYAVIDGETEFERISRYGQGTLKFIAFDPFAYSTTQKTFTPNTTNNIMVINNQGSAPTAPKFEIDFTNDCGYVALASPTGIIQVGNPKEVDGVKLPDSQRLINDAMTSTTGWTVNTSGKVRTGGAVIGGTIGTTGSPAYGIKPTGYGTNANGWHGVTIRKNLPVTADTTSSAQYWEASMVFEFKSDDRNNKTIDTKQMGRLEFNIMDESNNFLAGFTMRDSQSGYEYSIPEFWVGNTMVWEDEPKIPAPKKVKQYNKSKKKYEYKTVYPTHVGKWNDFYGKIIIRKSGTKFYFELQKIDSKGKVVAKATKTFYDKSNYYGSRKAKTTNIWFGAYKTNPPIGIMSATHVYFRKDYVADWKELPNLFNAGDKLIIDCETSQVYLNEALFMDRVDVGSTFFEVVEGETEVKFYHSGYAGSQPTVKATITEKFL